MNLMTNISTNESWELIYTLESGEERIFDVKPYLNYEAFQTLRDIVHFARVNNGRYFVEWECGADLSLDTLNAHSTILKTARLVA